MRTTTTTTMATALVALALVGCASATEESPPPAEPTATGVVAVSIDHAAAAMPADGDLPPGFELRYRCPGEEYCAKTPDVDSVSVVAGSDRRDDTGEAAWWLGGLFTFSVRYHQDTASAEAAAADAREQLADTTSGDFTIAAERTDNGFVPGQEGTGAASDYEVAGWAGSKGSGRRC